MGVAKPYLAAWPLSLRRYGNVGQNRKIRSSGAPVGFAIRAGVCCVVCPLFYHFSVAIWPESGTICSMSIPEDVTGPRQGFSARLLTFQDACWHDYNSLRSDEELNGGS